MLQSNRAVGIIAPLGRNVSDNVTVDDVHVTVKFACSVEATVPSRMFVKRPMGLRQSLHQ